MNENLIELLREELVTVDKALDILLYSYKQCQVIGVKDEYSYEELDKIESFTSRFARLSDILIQKLFRLIDKIDLEDQGTVRDRINRAEKKGLIDSADTFIKIRILRNDIAHEYLPDAIREIYKKVLSLTPHLIDSVKRVKKYSGRYEHSLN